MTFQAKWPISMAEHESYNSLTQTFSIGVHDTGILLATHCDVKPHKSGEPKGV